MNPNRRILVILLQPLALLHRKHSLESFHVKEQDPGSWYYANNKDKKKGNKSIAGREVRATRQNINTQFKRITLQDNIYPQISHF